VNQNNTILMRVKDNGVGLPEEYKQKQSLGVTVIESLSEQLDGNFTFSNDNGTCFELKFKHS
jgi:two-component sensor histidine kinase